jgi:hypothetical protein
MMTTCKVTGEYYRAIDNGYRVIAKGDNPREVVAAALGWLGANSGAHGVTVERVTTHEPAPIEEPFAELLGDLLGGQNETVTGKIVIHGAARLAAGSEMSRYDPVNGWVLPDTVET